MATEDFPQETTENSPYPIPDDEKPINSSVRSLMELIDIVSGKSLELSRHQEDGGYADIVPFPFLAIVGQEEMKLALLLAIINPQMGGVLLIGPRGTGKTTIVRSLIDLLPKVPRSLCFYGCLPEDIEKGGMDAVCPVCAKKYAMGEPISVMDSVRLVDLPLNSKIEDVIGGLDEKVSTGERTRMKKGLLAQADRNILYVDEINMLSDEIVDVILDAASQGHYTVRRGPISATYRSKFILIGSMNPEEGNLRPQIMDRFGLRVVVQGLQDPKQRLEAYKRVNMYTQNPYQISKQYQTQTLIAKDEIQTARELLPKAVLSDETAKLGLELISKLKIDSLRAEITLFEAAKAYAVADNRTKVTGDDIIKVAPLALRLRRSTFIADYLSQQKEESKELHEILNEAGQSRKQNPEKEE